MRFRQPELLIHGQLPPPPPPHGPIRELLNQPLCGGNAIRVHVLHTAERPIENLRTDRCDGQEHRVGAVVRDQRREGAAAQVLDEDGWLALIGS